MRRGLKIRSTAVAKPQRRSNGRAIWSGRLLAIVAGLAIGVVLAQEFWPEIEPHLAAHRMAAGRTHVQAPRQPGSGLPTPLLPGQQVIDPKVASLGTRDYGSKVALQLVLMSTSPGAMPTEGTAQIGSNPRNPQTYMAGTVLLNGARLSEIYRSYVVLKRNGQSARLYMQGTHGSLASDARSLLQVGGPQDSFTKVAPAPDTREPKAAQITDYIRPDPVFQGGELQGFVLYPGGKAGAFAKMGLAAMALTYDEGFGR